MIEGLKPYAEYKESDVPWIGRVPSDWRVERTKWIFRSKKELNVGRRNTNVLSLTLRGVVNNNPESPEGMVPKDYATYQLFRKHDLVFKLIDLENIRTSRVGLVHEDGIMSSAYVRLAPSKNVNIRFFYFQFFDLYTRAVFNALGAGVRSTLGATDLGEVRIAVPPPDEQAAIVRFLDHSNRKIDGFIRAKRKLIGLLIEQKQAIIHRAVTRGLHPDVPLKPSGIPWLGDIPKHWEMRKLRQILTRKTERNQPSLPLLSVVREKGVIMRDTENFEDNHNFIPDDLSNYKIVRMGQFAMNKMKAWQGSFGVSQFEGIVSPAYFVFNLRHVGGDFFHTAIRSKAYVPSFTRASDGVRVGQWDLAESRMRDTPFFIPPSDEQQAIVEYVAKATEAANTAIARTEREIALMQEYRTRLTADIVTGKLDVREAAATLPELPNAPSAEPATDEAMEEIEESEE